MEENSLHVIPTWVRSKFGFYLQSLACPGPRFLILGPVNMEKIASASRMSPKCQKHEPKIAMIFDPHQCISIL